MASYGTFATLQADMSTAAHTQVNVMIVLLISGSLLILGLVIV